MSPDFNNLKSKYWVKNSSFEKRNCELKIKILKTEILSYKIHMLKIVILGQN